MAPGDGQLAGGPRAVRDREVEQVPPLGGVLLLEQLRRLLREFENRDPLLDVVLVGGLVSLDLGEDPALLVPPLGGLPLEECGVDAPVEPVHVHRVDPVLQPAVVGLEAGHGFLLVPSDVRVARPQRLRHPAKLVLGEGDASEGLRELLRQDFLADVGLRALSLGVRAAVVDVAPLLDVADHRASAPATLDEPGEGEVVFHLPVALHESAVEGLLDLLPQFAGHERRVGALVDLALPLELAVVEPAPQDLVDCRAADLAQLAAAGQSLRACPARDLLERAGPGRVPLEHLAHDRPALRVQVDDLCALLIDRVQVAKRCVRGVDPLLGLLHHPLHALFAQVVDEVLRHDHADVMKESVG
ncbi:MAG: hypothetical protein L0216_03760 [Planctomycetales bacterium]|nr:hypothetical protein [Planctomycetales bacterium]